jgi:hypothetical protein
LALLAAIEAVVDVHKVGREAPWLANLYELWRRQGIDAESSRPLTTLVSALETGIRARSKMAALAVVLPPAEEMHPDLHAAVQRAAIGQRPFPLLTIGRADAKTQFAAIRLLGRPPTRREEWQAVSTFLTWRAELAEGLERWRALTAEFSLPIMPPSVEHGSRAVEPWLDRIRAAAVAAQRHAPFIEKQTPLLFPRGLNAHHINASLEHADLTPIFHPAITRVRR